MIWYYIYIYIYIYTGFMGFTYWFYGIQNGLAPWCRRPPYLGGPVERGRETERGRKIDRQIDTQRDRQIQREREIDGQIDRQVDGLHQIRLDQIRLHQIRLDQIQIDQIRLDSTRLDQIRQIDQIVQINKIDRQIGNWRVLSVLRVLREQERAMCRQMQQRLTARGLGGSCREGIGGF